MEWAEKLKKDVTVEVPAWALQFALTHADFCDCGPAGQGWASATMDEAENALCAVITKAVADPANVEPEPLPAEPY